MFFLSMGAVLLCYLRIKKHDIYLKIHHDTIKYEELCGMLYNLLGRDDAQYWVLLYLTSISGESLSRGEIAIYLKGLGYLEDPRDLDAVLSDFYRDWRRYPMPFQRLCQTIEGAENLE